MMQEKRAKTEPRLLIVGRGKERREEMGIAMRSGGFDIVEAASGLETVRLMNERIPDAIVCLWPRRGPHGELDLLRFLRDHDDHLLIVVVGVATEASRLREVLEAGADLCFPNSYDLDSLVTTVEMAIRRRRRVTIAKIHAGDLTVDITGHQSWRGEVELSLTPIEFRLLVSLMEHAGGVVSKATLLEECWRRYDDARLGGGHLVEVHLAALRHKLHSCGPPILYTVRAQGFILRPSAS
jgi:DNA-binding response OmpR family regulator